MTGYVGIVGNPTTTVTRLVERARRENTGLTRSRDCARDFDRTHAVGVERVVIEAIVGVGPLGIGARRMMHVVLVGRSPVMINEMEVDEQAADQI